MNIAFDALAVLGKGSKNRGIGNYAVSQIRNLLKLDRKNNYFVFNIVENTSIESMIGNFDNLHEFCFEGGADNFLFKNPSYKALLDALVKSFIDEHDIDVFYITSPFDLSNLPYNVSCFSDIKTVATVYDIIPYLFPKRYLSDNYTRKYYTALLENVKNFDRLAVISQSVKDDLIKHIGISKDKIDVIYAGVDDIYHTIELDEATSSEVCNRFGIKGSFIMSTSGDDPRKNIKELIIAFSKLSATLIATYQLVIVCKIQQTSVQAYMEVARQYNVFSRVVFTNFVTYEEMVILYNIATVMAFPSQYEGFGLPVIEAMSCGTPVLTSNNSSLGEVAQGAAVLVDPFDISDITRGLNEILTKADLNLLVQEGYKRAKLYSWERCAGLTLDCFNKLELFEKNQSALRKRIAFFTPLPSLKSGISDYSVDILTALSLWFDIDVFIDDGYTANCELPGNVTIYSHKAYAKNRSRYDETLYQMGNSVFHIYMIQYIQKYHGVVVLHDYNLHGLVCCIVSNYYGNDIAEYKKHLLEDYTEDETNKYLENWQSDKSGVLLHNMELNGFVINYANKIIVHSKYSKKKLLQRDIGKKVSVVPLYALIEEGINATELRKEKGISENDMVLAAFGHIHETKRAIPLLNAFRNLHNEFKNAKLYFVGELDINLKPLFEDFVANNDLSDRVIVTGYTELDDFVSYIDISDICVNLRYPYNGESSASLMRVLAKGKCTVVNDIGSFSEIPNECCIKVPSVEKMTKAQEIESIYSALKLALEDPEYRNKIAMEARKYAEEYLNIKIIAQQYVNVINDKSSYLLNEAIINELLNEEILSNHVCTERQVYELSKTLAYISHG